MGDGTISPRMDIGTVVLFVLFTEILDHDLSCWYWSFLDRATGEDPG